MSNKLFKPKKKKTFRDYVRDVWSWLWESMNPPKRLPNGTWYNPIRIIPRWMWYTVLIVFVVTMFKEFLL